MTLPNLASRPQLNSRPVWVLTAVAGMLGLLLLVGNLATYFSSSQASTAKLEQRAELGSQASGLATEVNAERRALDGVQWQPLITRVNGLNLILRGYSFSWLKLLDDLERVLPWQVRLFRIGPSVTPEGFFLQLTGAAQTRDAMLDFLENLIKDKSFREPLPHSETTPEGSASPGYGFDLKVEYLPGGEAP